MVFSLLLKWYTFIIDFEGNYSSSTCVIIIRVLKEKAELNLGDQRRDIAASPHSSSKSICSG